MRTLGFVICLLLVATVSFAAPAAKRKPSSVDAQGVKGRFACSAIKECSECPSKVIGVVSSDKEKNYEEFIGPCREACNDDCDGDGEDVTESK